MPLDVLLATMEYWGAQCARLVEREAEQVPTLDETGKAIQTEEAQQTKGDLR